jgi:hypothetical protein
VLHRIAFPVVSEWYQKVAGKLGQLLSEISELLVAGFSANEGVAGAKSLPN